MTKEDQRELDRRFGTNISDTAIKGLLMSTSINFRNSVDSFLRTGVAKGPHLIHLFLDTILVDNCSAEERRCFIEAMKEAIDKVYKDK